MNNKQLSVWLLLLCLMVNGISVAGEISVVHRFDKANPPGNVAVSKDGRIFMSLHQFFGSDNKVVEVNDDGSTRPYPDQEFSQSLNMVLGVIVDQQNILWMLETAGQKTNTGRLIGWDIANNKLYKEIYISAPYIPKNSFLNDLAVDREHNAVYITDTASGSQSALLVVDLNTGKVRRVLEDDVSTVAEDIQMVIDGKVVAFGDQPAQIGVNPITIDHANEWVYFAPMTGRTLYRVRTQDLLDETLLDEQLRERVESYASKPISDGIAIDNESNVYITDITNNAIGVIDESRKYKILHQGVNISWADGFATSAQQSLVVTINQLHRSPVLNNNEDNSTGEYLLMEFDTLAPTTVGR